MTWNSSYELFAIKAKSCSKGFTVLDCFTKASSSSQLMADLSQAYEALKPSENSICLFNGGQNNFIYKDIELPKLKEELILQSLTMQVDRHFPLHGHAYSIGFRSVSEESSQNLYRLICITKEKWNELVLLCQAAKFGVDAFVPGHLILDKFYNNELVHFNGKEYEVLSNGALKVYDKTNENSSLPFEINNNCIDDKDLSNFNEALLLAKYALSKDFLKENEWLSPLPEVVKPKRFKKAKNLIALQTATLIFCVSYFLYLYFSTNINKAKATKSVITELSQEIDSIPDYSDEILLLEQAKESLTHFNEDSSLDLTVALVELTRLLPENYSIKNLNYNASTEKITVSVRMENGVATELLDAFRTSSIFNNDPILNDSGNRLTLSFKSNSDNSE